MADNNTVASALELLDFFTSAESENWSSGQFAADTFSFSADTTIDNAVAAYPEERLKPALYMSRAKRTPKNTMVFYKRPRINTQFDLSELSFDEDGKLCRAYFVQREPDALSGRHKTDICFNAAKDFLIRAFGETQMTDNIKETEFTLPWGTVRLHRLLMSSPCYVTVLYN